MAWLGLPSSSLSAKRMGQGDRTKCGGGADGAHGPSTTLRMVPLPIGCADRED